MSVFNGGDGKFNNNVATGSSRGGHFNYNSPGTDGGGGGRAGIFSGGSGTSGGGGGGGATGSPYGLLLILTQPS